MKKKYTIDEIQEGMVVGRSVFDSNNRLIVADGFCLNREHIQLLRKKNITTLDIDVEKSEKIAPKTVISEKVKKELAETMSRFSKEVSNIVEKSRKNLADIRKIIKQDKHHITTILANSAAERVLDKVISDILREPWSVINLEKIREAGEEFHNYVLHVLVLSLCIGHKFRFTQNELKQLGLGAIVYDIGMLMIPKEILNKTGELDAKERSVFMQHTLYGCMMVSNIPALLKTSSQIALSHHEYQDGSGYPQGLKGDNRPPLKEMQKKGLINRFAEIVTVADTYDMLANGRRHFSPPLGPEAAIQKMIEMRKNRLNIEILKKFILMLPMYPVGTRIRVIESARSELMGCYGVVANVLPNKIFEPKVVLIESKMQKRLPKTIMLDFSKHKGIFIELA